METDTSMSVTNNHPREQVVLTRRLQVMIRGNMEKFATAGTESASWTPINGKSGDVFGVADVFDAAPDMGTTTSVLQSAVIHRVRVLETKNDFPVNLGVNISCIPSMEATKNGQRFALTCLSACHNPQPIIVYEAEASNSEGIEWRSRYPQYNASNLDTQGTLQVTGQPYVFVSQTHPVIELLKQNAELLNADITTQPLIDGEWYKLTKQVMSTCCNTLRNRVLSKVSTRDLNNFTVQIHRIHKNDWSNINTNDEIMSAIPHDIIMRADPAELTAAIQGICRRDYTFSARIEVEYECNV
jgi:hypothetical protein